MIKLLNSKKAVSPRVIGTIITGLIIFAFMSMIGVVFLQAILSTFETSSLYNSDMATSIKFFKASYYWWDYITLFLMVFFIIGVAITSYRLKARPIGFIISFIVAPFYGFISYFFNYYFIQLVSPTQIQAVQIYFPITMIICTNLHWIALITVIVGAIFAYNYNTESQGGGEYLA